MISLKKQSCRPFGLKKVKGCRLIGLKSQSCRPMLECNSIKLGVKLTNTSSKSDE